MRKILILALFCLICFCPLYSLAQNTKTVSINPEYKKETINWCPSFEESEKHPELVEKYGCGAGGQNYYSKKQFDVAYDYAKKIKYIYKTKDIEALANIAPYPNVYIEKYKNKKFIQIKSKEELLKLDKNALFGKSAYDEINNSAIFWNWRGFNLGRGSVWFFVEEDGSIGNLSIYVN